MIVTKHRYSAFIGTDLDMLLRARGVKSLLITGVGTGMCVFHTLTVGFMLDYYITLVEDCCATTYGPEALRAAFARGLEEQVIGAEYIGHYLAASVTMPPPISGDGTGRAEDRSWLLGHPGASILRDEQLRLDLPSAKASDTPHGDRS
jgi:hypothetical protein